jgi:hypothetical protein
LPFLACAGDLVFLLPAETEEDFPYAGFAADFFVAAPGDFLPTGAAEEDFLTLFVAALASPTERNPKDNTAAERKSLLDKDSELIALPARMDLEILDCCFFCAATFTFAPAQKDAD